MFSMKNDKLCKWLNKSLIPETRFALCLENRITTFVYLLIMKDFKLRYSYQRLLVKHEVAEMKICFLWLFNKHFQSYQITKWSVLRNVSFSSPLRCWLRLQTRNLNTEKIMNTTKKTLTVSITTAIMGMASQIYKKRQQLKNRIARGN